MAGEGISPIMSRRLVAATEAYAASAEKAATLEDTVHQVLNGTTTGVSVYQVPAFLALARSLSRLTEKFSGESPAVEASVINTKWISRGLTQSVVFAIREALGISAPVGP